MSYKGNSDATDKSCLIYIEEVKIDENAPKNERLANYRNQIKNPYNFICDGTFVKVQYTNNNTTLQDCIIHILQNHQD